MTIVPKQNGVSRDVQDELLKQRVDRRRRNGGVSPVKYQRALAVGDDWNCVFLKHLSQGVTMHPMSEPPKNVLDLGCGTGLWAIEAAKCWPASNVVGFDIRPIQPDLSNVHLGIEYKELSERVKWVHGDFLDPLPFEPDHFDLVRICCIGLSVPEDSWQDLLEECARVLKPGGCIEIIEEDLLFPAGRSRKPMIERTSTMDRTSTRDRTSTLERTSTLDRPSFADSLHQSLGERIRSDSTASRLTSQTAQSALTAATSSSYMYTTERSSQGSNSHDSFLSTTSLSQTDSSSQLLLQDHAKLKEAWEEMLSQRFLTHKLLNVLPFYLSSFFTNVHVHPTMHIVLPPPSNQRERSSAERAMRPDAPDKDVAHWVEDMRSHAVRLSTSDTAAKKGTLRANKASGATISLWSALHLARQVHLVSACKEAIWDAYCALTGAAREAFLHPDDAAKDLPREDLREEFEREWAAWESDMKDRIGMRDHVQEAVAWRDPETLSLRSGSWHSSSERQQKAPQIQHPEWDKASLCRSMRGLIAWKPAA